MAFLGGTDCLANTHGSEIPTHLSRTGLPGIPDLHASPAALAPLPGRWTQGLLSASSGQRRRGLPSIPKKEGDFKVTRFHQSLPAFLNETQIGQYHQSGDKQTHPGALTYVERLMTELRNMDR